MSLNRIHQFSAAHVNARTAYAKASADFNVALVNLMAHDMAFAILNPSSEFKALVPFDGMQLAAIASARAQQLVAQITKVEKERA